MFPFGITGKSEGVNDRSTACGLLTASSERHPGEERSPAARNSGKKSFPTSIGSAIVSQFPRVIPARRPCRITKRF